MRSYNSEGDLSLIQSKTNNTEGKRVLHATPSSKKHSSSHHGKIWHRSCRILLPVSCVARIFKLTNKLGLKSHGRTIEWMLSQLDQNIFSKDSHVSAANAKTPENPNSLNDPASPITTCQPKPPAAEGEKDQVSKAEMLPPNPDNGPGDGEWPDVFSPEDMMLLQSVFASN